MSDSETTVNRYLEELSVEDLQRASLPGFFPWLPRSFTGRSAFHRLWNHHRDSIQEVSRSGGGGAGLNLEHPQLSSERLTFNLSEDIKWRLLVCKDRDAPMREGYRLWERRDVYYIKIKSQLEGRTKLEFLQIDSDVRDPMYAVLKEPRSPEDEWIKSIKYADSMLDRANAYDLTDEQRRWLLRHL